MLTDDLASSYSSYKADTSMFTNWLFKSAKACGYEMPTITTSTIEDYSIPIPVLNTQPRLKGKARKLAKLEKESREKQKAQETVLVSRSPSKYAITTTEILKQAKLVTGKIELPKNIRKVLQRAIDARKRCADWFESSKFGNQYSNKDQGRSDRSHLNSTDISCKTSRKSQDIEPSWTETSNRFQNLDIEDCSKDSEVEDDEKSVEPNAETPGTSDTCELEEESLEMKMSMMVFYFFEDLHRIPDFLHGIWKKYKDKKLDLLSATLITNTAFEIVRRSEQEILNGAPKLFSKKRSYDAIAAVIFYANGLNTGKDPTQKMELKELLRPTPFDDFICLSTARILMKYDNLCEMNPTFPTPSLPLRAAYISCPEILGTPYMDKKEKENVLLSKLFIDLDLFNIYNRLTKEDESENSAVYAPPAPDALTAGLLRLKNEGQISVTVVFAAQIFLDLNEILGDDITEGHKDWGKLAWKGQSSLDSSGLWLPMNTPNTYWWSPRDLHTLKKICDINSRYTQSNRFRKLKEFWLRRTCSGPNWGRADGYQFAPTIGLVNRSDQESISTYAHQPMANKDAYCTEQGDLQGVQFSKDLVLTNTYTRFLECGLLSDGRVDPDWGKEWLVIIGAIARASDTEVYNKQLIKSVKHLDIRLIWPHSDVLFFYTHNPVYRGMIGLRLLTSYDEARLAHCDFHLVIIFMTHLYQECVRASFIQKVWPAMETMIQLHRKDIFNGNVPKSADEAYEKFSKQFFLSKVSSQEYARAKPPGEMTMPELSRKAFSQAIRPFLEHQATFN